MSDVARKADIPPSVKSPLGMCKSKEKAMSSRYSGYILSSVKLP